jgi:hypothetical protein
MNKIETELDIIRIITEDQWMMDVLRIVKSLQLNDWWIGAGFVRNKIWDFIHGYSTRTPLDDIDVIYYNPPMIPESIDKEYEMTLKRKDKGLKWSVKNQARMHSRNADPPYSSIVEAISRWTETATAIAVTIDQHEKIAFIAPFGITDLINLIIRPTPAGMENIEVYKKRIKEKKWQVLWPMLQVLYM